METIQKSLCHLHYTWEELMQEIYLQSSYMVKGMYTDDATGVVADALILSDDEQMLTSRFLSDGYSKIFDILSGFMKEGGGGFSPGSHIDFSLMIPNAVPPGVLERLAHLVKQCLVYYVLCRWFMVRNQEMSAYCMQLAESAYDEIRSCLNRRTVPITRKLH